MRSAPSPSPGRNRRGEVVDAAAAVVIDEAAVVAVIGVAVAVVGFVGVPDELIVVGVAAVVAVVGVVVEVVVGGGGRPHRCWCCSCRGYNRACSCCGILL